MLIVKGWKGGAKLKKEKRDDPEKNYIVPPQFSQENICFG